MCRIISNEYCNIREHPNIDAIQNASSETIEISTIHNSNAHAGTDIDNCEDIDFYRNSSNTNNYNSIDCTLSLPSRYNDDYKKLLETTRKKIITLGEKIADWIITNNISHNAANKLLSIMRSENLPVPNDCKTLLKSPSYCNNIVEIPHGTYGIPWH